MDTNNSIGGRFKSRSTSTRMVWTLLGLAALCGACTEDLGSTPAASSGAVATTGGGTDGDDGADPSTVTSGATGEQVSTSAADDTGSETGEIGSSETGDSPEPQCGVVPPCPAEGWCWDGALPGNSVYAMRGASRTSLWAVGSSGMIMRSEDGENWAAFESPTQHDLRALLVFSETDALAVGNSGTAVRWNGACWEPESVTVDGQAVEADLISLRQDAEGTLWAGGLGRVFHKPLGSVDWVEEPLQHPNPINLAVHDIYAGPAMRVAATELGLFEQTVDGDGSTLWVPTTMTQATRAFWDASDDDVWALGDGAMHWDGTQWSAVETPLGFQIGSAWAAVPDDIWAVTNDPARRVFRWDGAVWNRQNLLSLQHGAAFRTIWGSGPGVSTADDDIWLMGDGRHTQRFGNNGYSIRDGTTSMPRYAALVAWSDEDAVAIPSAGSVRIRDADSGWTSTFQPSVYAEAGWASAEGDIWTLSGGGSLVRREGGEWIEDVVPNSGFPVDMWGSSGSDIWVANRDSSPIHWDGVQWQTFPIAGVLSLASVWGSAPDDFWGVSGRLDDGGVMHWDGATWTPMPVELGSRLTTVRGSAPDDVWFCGEEGLVVHWDGTAFAAQTIPPERGEPAPDLEHLWVTPSTAYVIEEHFALSPNPLSRRQRAYQLEAGAWSSLALGSNLPITAIGGHNEHVWMSNTLGGILTR